MRNRKKLFSALLVSTFMLGAVSVNADAVANETDLANCLGAADAKTCTLSSDVTISNSVTTKGEKTLELGDYTITDSAASQNMVGLIILDDASNSKLTINGATGKIESKNLTVPVQLKDNTTLIVNGGNLKGYHAGIYADAQNTNITINGGTVSSSYRADEDIAIIQTQGNLLVTGGTIEGGTGIEVQSGSLTVNGGTINGLATKFDPHNDTGATAFGAGISVRATAGNVAVTITDGKVTGFVPFYEGELNTTASTGTVTLDIQGGTFETTNTTNGDAVVVDSNKVTTGFISGGKFSGKVPTGALVNGTYLKEDGTVDTYKVELSYSGDLASHTMTPANPKPGDVVTIQFTLNENAKIFGYNANGLEVEDKGNGKYEFTMPSANVNINFSINDLSTVHEIYTTSLTQNLVNEHYSDWKEFNMYFSEDAESVIVDTLSSLVEDLDSKHYYLYAYPYAYETDYNEIYDDMSEEGKKKFDEFKKLLPSGNTIVGSAYIGVSVWDNEAQDVLVEVEKLNKKATISLQLPDAYEGKSKYYGLARVVDGKLEVVRGTLSKDGKTVAFTTDQLGDFFLVYGDIANPATYDGILVYGATALVAVAGIAALTLISKKKIFNK